MNLRIKVETKRISWKKFSLFPGFSFKIDWCFMPTIAIFQLYRGVFHFRKFRQPSDVIYGQPLFHLYL